MGLFDRFFKKHGDFESAIIEIARLISFGDRTVMHEVGSCVINIKKYSERNKELYAQRGMDIDSENEHTLIWIALADSLIKAGFAKELDWKCSKEDFVDAMSSLCSLSVFGIVIDQERLFEEDDVSLWCAALDDILSGRQLCVGGVDIESDSYVLFICKTEVLEELSKLSAKIYKRISRGAEL